MKKYNRLIPMTVACAVLATGCGVVKSREDRVVVASQNPAYQQAGSVRSIGSTDSEDDALKQIKQFLDLYTQNGAMTREGLTNFLEKYKAQIGPFLAGAHMSSQELVDLIFAFDADHDGQVTPQEISDGLMKRIPILRWIPDNATAISRDELLRQIQIEYPQASDMAQAGLCDVLMRFDESFAEGNGDGKVSRSELSGAGLIIGVIGQTDFSKGFTIPPGAIPPVKPITGSTNTIDVTPLAAKLIQQKIDQQLFTRYSVQSSQALSQDDLRLEWMQLALRFFLIDKLVHHSAPTDGDHAGQLAMDKALSALSGWGIPEPAHYSNLLAFYDTAALGGDGDGHISSLEAFNYLSDLEFARKLRVLLSSDFSARSLSANPAKIYILSTLKTLMPRTGQALFMNDLDPKQLAVWGVRTEYWDGFTRQFDNPVYGGNGDGKIDDGEAAMGLMHAKLVEDCFELYDTNHDTYLVRSEGNAMFAVFGITDSRVIDAIYGDVDLEYTSPNFWQKLHAYFAGDRGFKWLRPYDFEIRLVQLAPRLLNPEDR